MKQRLEKLYSKSISDVTSHIVIFKDDKMIKKVIHGTNPEKVIALIVRL